jgi:putative intracellular protease/amidase
MIKVLIMMADYGHDVSCPPPAIASTELTCQQPTETAVPYMIFRKAGFTVDFATENGATPACDKRLLEGLTQKLLGATADVIKQYQEMEKAPEWQHPLVWSKVSSLDYDALYFPGGHEKSVRQAMDSPVVHEQVAKFFPQTRRPGKKVVSALCHGVQTLANSKIDGRSVLYDVETTALPTRFEQIAFWGTRLFLGDYYKTYGAGTDNVEQFVTKELKDEKQFKNSLSTAP